MMMLKVMVMVIAVEDEGETMVQACRQETRLILS